MGYRAIIREIRIKNFRSIVEATVIIWRVYSMTSIAEEHMGFADELNDAKLLNLAVERMKKADSTAFVPAERLNKELGITQDDLDTVGDVDIE